MTTKYKILSLSKGQNICYKAIKTQTACKVFKINVCVTFTKNTFGIIIIFKEYFLEMFFMRHSYNLTEKETTYFGILRQNETR